MRQDFDEMIACFNRRVSEMNIAMKDKLELLGMVTAIAYLHENQISKYDSCMLEDENGLIFCPNCGAYMRGEEDDNLEI